MQLGVSEAKMTCESCVAVWDNGRRDSMKKEYLVHENLCDWGGCIWRDESTKMMIFGELINHNQDYNIPSKFRETFNEIHWNIYPNPCRDKQVFEQSRKKCDFTHVVLEGFTFGYHMLNLSFHSLPKEVTLCPLICFHEPRVPCQWRSMEFINYCLFNICALVKHQTTHVSRIKPIPRWIRYHKRVTDQLLDDFREWGFIDIALLNRV